MAPEIRKIAEAKYYESPNECPECGKVIPYKKKSRDRISKFCNQSCAAIYHNTHVLKKQYKVKKTFKKCLECNCNLNSRVNKFCSRKCKVENYFKEKIPFILLGQISDRRILKFYLVSIKGHQCEECGLKEWIGRPAPLVLDHVDGNAGDNSLKNLRLLCQNCNAFTPTFTGKNRGKGRGSRGLSLK
jgi:hypothetical protein